MTKTRVDGAQSIHRAIELLRLIARHGRDGAPLSVLAQLSGLSPSTARRILNSLVEDKMALRAEAGRNYLLGPLVGELALLSPSKGRLLAKWHPVLERICASVHATTYLVMRSDLDTVVLDGVDGRGYLRAVPFEIGQRYPLGVGAGGVAMLAAQDDDQVEAILQANASQYRAYDEGNPQRIRAMVEQARAEGYAFTSKARRMRGVCGLGVAVPNAEGPPILAISVAAVGEMLAASVRAKLARELRRMIASAL